MRCLVFALLALFAVPGVLACSFTYDPVSIPQYYRAEGWTLPGTDDFNPSAVSDTSRLWLGKSVPGAVAQALPHESPYVVEFPGQQFLLNGKKQKMRSAAVMSDIVRWKMRDRAVAYSYSMIPVVAHRLAGKWVIEAEAACIYFATFIDDKGDGVFRVLVPSPFTADLVPLWAKPKKN